MKQPEDMLRAISTRLTVMRGEQSILMPPKTWDYMRSLRDDMAMISIPQSQHHVMLDQPLAYVAALRSQLAAWVH